MCQPKTLTASHALDTSGASSINNYEEEYQRMIPAIGDSIKGEQKLGTLKVSSFHAVYNIGEKIGEGSFGVVYKTYHVSDPSETFAVKIETAKTESHKQSVLDEVSILRKLICVPHVIQLIDFYIIESTNTTSKNDKKSTKQKMFTVQSIAKGGDVLDRLSKKEHYTEYDARDLAETLISTINHIHNRGIVHRDLKLENLLLQSNDDDAEILICDFGYGKILRNNDDDNILVTLCGTAEYTAPEIWKGDKYGKKVDMWSIGCILYLLLGGYFPFGEDRKGDLLPRIIAGDYDFDDDTWNHVSSKAKETISNLLEVDINKRWTAMQALRSDWFIENSCEDRETLRRSNLRLSLDKLQSLHRRRKFRAVVDAVSVCQRMSIFIKN